MKYNLRTRLTLSFLGIIVATAGLMVLLANRITANRFTYMVSRAGQMGRITWRRGLPTITRRRGVGMELKLSSKTISMSSEGQEDTVSTAAVCR